MFFDIIRRTYNQLFCPKYHIRFQFIVVNVHQNTVILNFDDNKPWGICRGKKSQFNIA